SVPRSARHAFPTRRSSDLASVTADAHEANLQHRERWLRHLRLERNLSRNTLDSYRRDTDRYLAWLGKRSVTELNTGDVESFMARSEEHTSELQSRFDLVCR